LLTCPFTLAIPYPLPQRVVKSDWFRGVGFAAKWVHDCGLWAAGLTIAAHGGFALTELVAHLAKDKPVASDVLDEVLRVEFHAQLTPDFRRHVTRTGRYKPLGYTTEYQYMSGSARNENWVNWQ